eukprot:TRINITY_DN9804_c0_g2_i1.p1 TRINITY_DN9804_c0_g2~~TRINITY_DN9804_c0_g2_i1.p1  ORF type:complete len:659 (+),score=172.00 TRINITY_DN9804_c0_g2_i1:90-1979(+)
MEPYVLIQNEEGAKENTLTRLTGPVKDVDMLDGIPRKKGATGGSAVFDTFSILPFSTMTERSLGGSALYEAKNEGEKIRCMDIEKTETLTVDAYLASFEAMEVGMTAEMTFDKTKDEYEAIIKKIVEDEIGKGEGSSFVTPRKCMGTIDDFSDAAARSIYKRLLKNEYGCYWKFLFFDGVRYFIGASPERQLSVRHGKALMNPISGTFRKTPSNSRDEELAALKKFLQDKKEINELFMVTDEELKMMSTMCGVGGRIVGPLLKEMAHLIHTEYLLEGKPNKGEDVVSLLRKSMFAPTVIGSPVGNACKIVAKYEPRTRSYYSSCVMLLGREADGEDFLDSSITIRTLEVEPTGEFSIRVGATLVKDSIPSEEFAECEAKVRGAITALKVDREFTRLNADDDEDVKKQLATRNVNTSRFWMSLIENEDLVHHNLKGKKVVLSHNEDDFIFMLRHILERTGCDVTVLNFWETNSPESLKLIDNADVCVVGPGPGDPTDASRDDGKMKMVKQYLEYLLEHKKPFLAVCLGHQVLSHHLGFEVIQKDLPTQGIQKEVDLYGKKYDVGFYNAYYAVHDAEKVAKCPITEVALDGPEMLSTRGPHWESFQFHPESILTVEGFEIVKNSILRLVSL